MLLYMVNDILDLKMIKIGKYVPVEYTFSPLEAFNNVMSMFDK